jgi:hypothetical protein
MANKRRPQKEERSGTFTGAWLEKEDRVYLEERAKALRLRLSDVLRLVIWKARTRGETFSDLGPDADAARKAGL